MSLKKTLPDKKICNIVLFFYIFLAMLPSSGEAHLMESRLSSGEKASERAQSIESIRQVLEYRIAEQRLNDFGLSREQAITRLESMDDEQLHQLASLSDELGGGGVDVAVALLLIGAIILIILKLSLERVIIE